MVRVEMQATVRGHSATEAFNLLSDLEKYPACVDAVRHIVVSEENGRSFSSWEVNFHGGIMRWKEEDVFLRDQNALQFRQIEGDVDYFSGEWRVTDEDGGCRIVFWADFDLGLSGLSLLLEPIAESALKENIRGIINGLLGPATFA